MVSNGDQKPMLASERLLEIEERFGAAIERIVPLELEVIAVIRAAGE